MIRIAQNNMVSPDFIQPLFGGGQNGAPVLRYGYNYIIPPASAYDSIQLPEAIAGSVITAFVIGSQDNLLTIYPLEGSGNTINLTGTDSTAFDFPNFFYAFPDIATGQSIICVCPFDGNWFIGCQQD